MSEKTITFSGCEFDQDEESQSSISNIDRNKQRTVNQIEVFGCEFKGKLSKSSHYIDGLLHTKEKIKVASCTFKDKNKESPVNIQFDDNDSQISIEINTNYTHFSNRLYMIVLGIAFFVLMCILARLKVCYSNNKHAEIYFSGYLISDEFTEYSNRNHQIQSI